VNTAAVLAALAVLASAVVQILTDPRITRDFLMRSLLATAVYLIHCGAGVTVVAYLLPRDPGNAGAIAAGILGWIGLGMLGLIRFAPRLREPPRVLLHVGVADAACLLMIAFAVASAFGAFRQAGA
jgi:hypothetical protein